MGNIGNTPIITGPLNTTVSAFANAKATDPHPVNLADWLRSTRQPRTPAELRRVEIIQAIRNHPEINDPDSEAVKELKKSLPGITPGAVCKGGKKEHHVIHETAFMQFDIDIKENPHLPTGAALREAVSNIQNVFFAGLSTRGAGVWGLIKVSDPGNWPLHFEQLKKDFAIFGVVLDSKGKNPHDLRFYSYDPDAFINPDAFIYCRKAKPPPPKPAKQHNQKPITGFTDADRIETITRQIEAARVDITSGYDTWLSIAYGISDILGGQGRDTFHRLSQFYNGYDYDVCDRQYTACMKSSVKGDIAPFFRIARDAGFNFMDEPEKRLSYLPSNARTQTNPSTNTPDYPADWDDITVPPGTSEFDEATRAAFRDADPDDMNELDPLIPRIIELFDAEIIE